MPISEYPRQLPSLLRDPGRFDEGVQPAKCTRRLPSSMKKEHVQPLQPDRSDGEEIGGEHVLTVDTHELAPGHAPSGADWSPPRVTQPRPHVGDALSPSPFSLLELMVKPSPRRET